MPHLTESSSPSPVFDPKNYCEAMATRRQIIARLTAVKNELDRISHEYHNQVEAVKCLKNDLDSVTSDEVVSLNDYRDLRDLVDDANDIGAKVMEEECGLRNEQAVLESRLSNINEGIQIVKKMFKQEKRKVVSLEGFRSKAEGRN